MAGVRPGKRHADQANHQFVESPANPRKRYDDASLQELAQSIRSQGILAPLLVRGIADERYESSAVPAAS